MNSNRPGLTTPKTIEYRLPKTLPVHDKTHQLVQLELEDGTMGPRIVPSQMARAAPDNREGMRGLPFRKEPAADLDKNFLLLNHKIK